MPKYFMGLDLGTSSVKLMLLDDKQKVLSVKHESYVTIEPEKNHVEQRPSDWTDAIVRLFKRMNDEFGSMVLNNITAIGLSAQMPTLVLADKAGNALGNAVVRSDSRAEEQAGDILDIMGREEHYLTTGVVLDAHYIAPMYKWFDDNGQLRNDVYSVLSAKDYLALWLTGKRVTDPSTASGYGVYDINECEWDEDMCDYNEIPIELLPEIKSSLDMVGWVRPEIAKLLGISEKALVANGGADSVMGVFGVGAASPGTVCQIWGSEACIIGYADKIKMKTPKHYLITPMVLPKTYAVEADIQTAGSAIAWMDGLLRKSFEENNAGGGSTETYPGIYNIARRVPIGAHGIFFCPYLSGGEQSVLWDKRRKPTVIGKKKEHGLMHISRALLEGLCFETRRVMEYYKKEGIQADRVVLTGGVTESAFFMQMLADVLGCEIIISADKNGSAKGAALCAGIATGEWTYASVLKGNDNTTTFLWKQGNSYKPDEKNSARYNELYVRYIKESEKSIVPFGEVDGIRMVD